MKKILLIFIILVLTNSVSAFQITNKNIDDLKFGKTNPTVKELQIFLNENGFYESEEGPGSPGNETEYFGKSTQEAVKIFQEYSEIKITGKVDLATGKAINNYIKEIKEEEEKYQNSIDNYANQNNGYQIDTTLEDTYKDSASPYINPTPQNEIINSTKINPSKKQSLKDIFEGLPKEKETPEQKRKHPTSIFQNFFSIFK